MHCIKKSIVVLYQLNTAPNSLKGGIENREL